MTSTPSFGSSKRESHDASAFYERFAPPEFSTDETVNKASDVDKIVLGDSRKLDLPDNSVALVVTSPPYFVGKDYEKDLEAEGVPKDYIEFLEMLRQVLLECKRVLEPGGRMAINVANLGRKPYRSLSADVITILQNDLGMMLRGEIIWIKAKGASGSVAWGSWRQPGNPTMRDLTERIIVASKGRPDRAIKRKKREALGLPSESTISAEEFMAYTLDTWEMAPESAKRIGHPAPFPVELPRRLIELHTYKNDLVLDPFMGSGTTAVAAVRTGRHFIGYDMDKAYVDKANERITNEKAALEQ